MKISTSFSYTLRDLIKPCLYIPLLFSVAIVSASVPTAELVGEIGGNFEVKQGAATYGIPIQVPPGVAGMQPSLSLNYNSKAGNGVLGVGWSLGGLSSIHRCSQTIAQDGKVRGVDYSTEDRFCLDGKRLVAVNGSETEYRTEIDSYSKIISYGVQENAPLSWKVWTKSGRVMEYGATEGARIEAQGKTNVRVWALNKMSDIVGNAITVSYEKNSASGQYYPSRIDYGNHSVRFEPETRSDSYDRYQAGVKISLTKRLASITSYVGDTPATEYRLSYGQSLNTAKSRLEKITQCDRDNLCLEPLVVDWYDYPFNGLEEHTGGVSPSGWSVPNSWPGDYNGDGLADLVSYTDGNLRTFMGNGDGTFEEYDFTVPTGGWSVTYTWPGDFNGDGRTDLVSYADGNLKTFMANGDGTFEEHDSAVPTGGWSVNYTWPGDYDGDGRTDLLSSFNGNMKTFIANGNGSFTEKNGFVTTVGWSLPYTWSGDYNGDGLKDLVSYYSGNLKSFLAQGDGTFAERNTTVSTSGWSSTYTWPGDYNGDGRTDLLSYHNGNMKTFMARGDGTFAEYDSAVSTGGWYVSDTWTGDFNGDGRTDLHSYVEGKMKTFIANGDGTFEEYDFTAPTGGWSVADTWPGDYNGDGRTDLLSYAFGNMKTFMESSQKLPDLVKSIDVSGKKISLNYDALTNSDIYEKTAAIYPERSLQSSQYVITAVNTANGIGGISSTSIRYGGLKADIERRSSLGFAWVEATDDQTEVRERTEYNQGYPLTGRPIKIEVQASDGVVQSEAETRYESVLNYDDTVSAVYQSRHTERTNKRNGERVKSAVTVWSGFEPNAGTIRTQTHTTCAGSITSATTDPEVTCAGESHKETTTNNYHSDYTDSWHIGRVANITTWLETLNNAAVTDSVSRFSSYEYYPESDPKHAGLLWKELIEPNNQELWQTKAIEYDDFGNQYKTTITGADPEYDTAGNLVNASNTVSRTTTTQYDSQGLFPMWSENALGHSEEYIDYDLACGRVKSLKGPNALTTGWEYDSLCRKKNETRADGTTTNWTYQWVDPQSIGLAHAYYSLTTSSSGQPPSTFYYDTFGREIRQESVGFDGRPVYQDTTYNALGQVEKTSMPYYQGDTVYWIETHYDDIGRVDFVTRPFPGGITTYSYDGLITTKTNALNQNEITRNNILGQVEHVHQEEGAWVGYEYDPAGNLKQTNANGLTTQMAYDIRGNKTSMDDPNMGHWEYRYDALGNLKWQKDAKGQVVNIIYDSLGRMKTRSEPEGVSTWIYDTATNGKGKLAEVQAPLGYRKEYRYNDYGLPSLFTTHADGQHVSQCTKYDAYGRIEKVATKYQDLNKECGWSGNQSFDFEVENLYTDQGFLKAVRSPKSQNDDYDLSHIQFLLDTAINDATSALASATDYANNAQYYYDTAEHYRTLSGDVTLDASLTAQLQSSATTLDAAGDLLVEQMESYIQLADELLEIAEQLAAREEILQDRYAYTNTIDMAGDYQDLLNDGSQIVFWQARDQDASGRISEEMTGNGLLTQRVYDPATGQLNYITSGFGYNTKIRNLEYQYDSLNNVESRQDHVQGLSESFQHDNLNRLTQSSVSGTIYDQPYQHTIDYDYNPWGNIIHNSDLGYYSYDYGNVSKSRGYAGPQALFSVDGRVGYDYDENGNMIRDASRNIGWSSFSKPNRFEKTGTGQVTTFSYDPERARYLKVTNSSRTLYIDKSYERITEGESLQHKHFIYAAGEVVAIHIKSETSGVAGVDQTRYLHRDSLGSIDTITDGQGRIVDRMSYDPFGKRRGGDWRAANDPMIPILTNRGFTGHEHVDEMGLIHMNGRVYDPEIGRFLSADPTIPDAYDSQAFNRYSYVNNRPMVYTDPSGYEPEDDYYYYDSYYDDYDSYEFSWEMDYDSSWSSDSSLSYDYDAYDYSIDSDFGGSDNSVDWSFSDYGSGRSSSNGELSSPKLEHSMTTASGSAVRPDLEAVANDPNVHAEIDKAWAASNPHTPGSKIENGFWIIRDDATKALSVQTFPMVGATRDRMSPGLPPVIYGKTTTAFFHTHPNTVAEKYINGPSPPDLNFANHRSINLPGIIRSHTGMYYFGPALP